MVLEARRKETPFDVRDNMLNIWNQITELSMRGFGLQKRKKPKTPRNFKEWSETSQKRWMAQQEAQYLQKEQWDKIFVANETKVVDDLCRRIVYLIDSANQINPQLVCETYTQRLQQDEAITTCYNLKRELNHIAETIPSNINFLALQMDSINKEISLLRGWRKSCNEKRKIVMLNELKSWRVVATKNGYDLRDEDLIRILKEMLKV